MDEKTMFLNSIIMAMSACLNEQQLSLLKEALIRELEYVSITMQTKIMNIIDYQKDERLFKLFVASKRLEGASEKTIKSYSYETKKLLERLNKSICDVQTVDIQYYLSEYEKIHKISRRSVDNMRRAIKGFYIWMYDNKYISENPVNGIKPIAFEKKKIEVLSDEEIYAIREQSRINLRTRAIVELLLATGIRVSELCAINMEDIDFKNNEILIHCSKKRRKEDRILFLTVEAKKCLYDYLIYRNKLTTPDIEALFIANRNGGRRVTERVVNTTLRNIESHVGLKKKLTVHTFRRTLASCLYSKGMSPHDIAVILGHADSRMSETYYIKARLEDVKANYYKCK